RLNLQAEQVDVERRQDERDERRGRGRRLGRDGGGGELHAGGEPGPVGVGGLLRGARRRAEQVLPQAEVRRDRERRRVAAAGERRRRAARRRGREGRGELADVTGGDLGPVAVLDE